MMRGMNTTSRFIVLCYHYLRESARVDPFPRVLGTKWSDFEEHLRLLRARCTIISLRDVLSLYGKRRPLPSGRPNVLLTFDDGLAEHRKAASLLAHLGIRAVFFVPSCILEDEAPINSAVMHYTIARYGIGAFLEAYAAALSESGLRDTALQLSFEKGKDDPWEKIAEIKRIFKYALPYEHAERITRSIYRALLLSDMPDIFSQIHLSVEGLREIVKQGHDIGSHTHSHLSLGAHALTDASFEREAASSQRILEQVTGSSVRSFSYPFGEKNDYRSIEERLARSGLFDVGFVAEPGLNTVDTPPLHIARYLVHSSDTPESVYEKVIALEARIT